MVLFSCQMLVAFPIKKRNIGNGSDICVFHFHMTIKMVQNQNRIIVIPCLVCSMLKFLPLSHVLSLFCSALILHNLLIVFLQMFVIR